MTFAAFEATARSYLKDAHSYAINNRVGEEVKKIEQNLKGYGAEKVLLSLTAIYAGLKTAQVTGKAARISWEKGKPVGAIAWSAISACSAALAGWGICYTARNSFNVNAQPKCPEPVCQSLLADNAEIKN